ncbi:MAG: NAD(+)/NADH kinase [Oscillospiraceae bacterium]|nr:NAD(+)/NADH kinase [Oscillospiraceae bacterium]
MKIALMPNFGKLYALKTALDCCDILNSFGIEVLAEERFKKEFAVKGFVSFGSAEDISGKCDIMIAIGGDGTILTASAYASVCGKPLLGINTGRLGFMASMERDELDGLERLKTGDYTTEERMMLDAELVRGGETVSSHTALNDVVIARPYSKITDYEISTDGIVVSSMRSDGMVFATPTGSTAYALSAGGPILEPETECIQLTPICPHSLFSRTMVFKSSRELEVRHFSDDDSVYFTVDGKFSCALARDERLVIKKSKKKLRLIDIKGQSFFDAVNSKLMNPIK